MIAALLLNEEIITKKELLTMLCSLSYMGDTRMKIAENPKKVENIVNGSYNELISIYNFTKEYMKELDNEHVAVNISAIRRNLKHFPISLKEYIKDDFTAEAIIKYLTELNRRESKEQTIKGIKTNGVVKSADYASKKLAKRCKH